MPDPGSAGAHEWCVMRDPVEPRRTIVIFAVEVGSGVRSRWRVIPGCVTSGRQVNQQDSPMFIGSMELLACSRWWGS